MALSAKFLADFSDFSRAVELAEVQLKGFEGDANKVASSLDRMSNSLKGNKMVQQATIMAQAVEKIGGVSKLTDSELQRLGAQAKEAADKLSRMGEKVPENLQKIITAAKPVDDALQKVATSLSGTTLIRDARLMADGVDKIGGVSKLTQQELQRLAVQAQEAVAKMKVLGVGVPENLQKIAGAAKPVTLGLSDMLGAARSVASVFGIGFGIGALVGLGREVLGAADAFKKMAQQAGITTEEAQKLNYIAGQTSVSVESLIGAAQNLQQRLGDDNTGAAGAMAKLRINTEEFNKLNTYQEMTTLGSAIKDIKDPTEQASVAAALFGKTWKEILPAIKEGMKEVGDQAPQMADSVVESLGRLDDAIKREKQAFIAGSGVILGELLKISDGARAFFSKLDPSQATSQTQQLANALDVGLKGALDQATAAAAKLTKDGLQPLGAVTEPTKVQMMDLNRELERQVEKTKKAWEETQKAIDIQKRFTDSVNDATIAMNLSVFTLNRWGAVELPNLSASLDDVRDQLEGWIQPLKDATGEIEALQRSGRFAAAAFVELNKQIIGLPNVTPSIKGADLEREVKGATNALGDLSQAFAQLAQISGDSWGGPLQGIGKVIASANVLKTSMDVINKTVGEGGTVAWGTYAQAASNAFALVLTGYGALMGYIDNKNAAIMARFNEWSALGQSLVERLGKIQSVRPPTAPLAPGEGKREWEGDLSKIRELEAASDKLWASYKTGSIDAIRAAAKEFDALLTRYEEIAAMASSKFGPSQSDLVQAAKDAQDVFQYMADSGNFTAEQLTKAYRAYQQQLADTGDEAAKMWLKIHGAEGGLGDEASAAGYQTIAQLQEAADKAEKLFEYMRDSGKYTADQIADAFKKAQDAQDKAMGKVVGATTKAFDALIARRDELDKALAKEMPEPEIGEIEKRMIAERDALNAQIKAQEAAINSAAAGTANAAAQAVDKTTGAWKEGTDEWSQYAEQRAVAAAAATTIAFDATASALEKNLIAAAEAASKGIEGQFKTLKIDPVKVTATWDVASLPTITPATTVLPTKWNIAPLPTFDVPPVPVSFALEMPDFVTPFSQSATAIAALMHASTDTWNDFILQRTFQVADATSTRFMQAATAMRDSFVTAADDAASKVKNSFAFEIRIPIHFDPDPLGVNRMATGGSGTVTKPTLFLAGEAGPEQYAFSGANRRFPDRVGAAPSRTTSDRIVIRPHFTVNVRAGTRELKDVVIDILEHAPNSRDKKVIRQLTRHP